VAEEAKDIKGKACTKVQAFLILKGHIKLIQKRTFKCFNLVMYS